MEIAFSTDVGKKRSNNEDYAQVYHNQTGVTFAVVADGMGGHRGGDVASDMVVTHLGEAFLQTDLQDIHQIAHWADDFLDAENERVIEAARQQSELMGMGTTLVGAFVVANELLVVNVGDSRCYLLSDNDFKQLSFDHSLVNELLVAGEITPEEAINFPNKNIITQSLGVSEGVQPTFGFFDLQPNAQVLLCSDGLTNMVSDAHIKAILQQRLTPQQKCDLLIETANAAGGLDNITALVIDMAASDEVHKHDK